MKVIVIGINHAGTSAIRTLLELNKDIEVLAFDRNSNISFLGCGIALSVSGVVKNVEDLFYSNSKQLQSMGAKVFMRHDVLEIDQKAKNILVKNLETNETESYTYDKLIYGCGSWPIDLKIKNSQLKNVNICKTFQHAQELINDAKDDSIKNVVIIGAGYIGIELVESFIQKNKNVHLIDLQPRVLFNNVDEEISSVIEDELKKHGVKLHLNQSVSEYGGSNKLEKLTTSTGETINCDLAIECVGVVPNTSLLKDVKKLANNSVIVNKKCLSSDPNIYVIGDACALYNAATEKYQNIALATNAVKTGIVAACDICNINQINLDSVVGTNALCVFDKKIATTGISEATAKKMGFDYKAIYFEDNDRPEWMNQYSKVAIKLVYEKTSLRLLGAQILTFDNSNHSEWILALGLAIQKSMNLFQIATSDVYFLPHFNKPFNFVLSAILKALGFNYFNQEK